MQFLEGRQVAANHLLCTVYDTLQPALVLGSGCSKPTDGDGGGALESDQTSVGTSAYSYHCEQLGLCYSSDCLFKVQEVFVRPLNEFVSLWWTFGGGTKLIVDLGVVQPTLTLLPPSTEELQQGSATLVCVASGGFPPTWRLGWKVGGTSSSSVVSDSLEVLGRDGYYSWSSTLSLGADQWRKAGSVSCEASLTGQSPVTQTLDPDHCSQ
ncbi:immunoglobulin lambda-like polypeptide 5 [Genypterus blacodes]|uniref:immunoglobulin lambda-like polypeptide 5 n=1 Tax=Genypterus blacodes TaxID=154954 RepID=UPI003F7605E4